MVDAMKASEQAIVRATNEDSIDAGSLMSRDAWKRICQIRGKNFRAVDEEAWQDLCARRGYLLERQNPRGF